jgi:hypothetical protein
MVEISYNIAVTMLYICSSILIAAFTTLIVTSMAYGTIKAAKDYSDKNKNN